MHTGPRFQILGPLRLWQDGVEREIGPPQQAYVLALLLARAGRPVSTNDLIDLVWGDEAPSSALNILHKYVGTLRRLLEPALSPRETGSYLVRRGNGYQIIVGPDKLDLSRFRMLTRTARTSRAAGHLQEALDHYVDALRLWSGSTADALLRGSSATSIATALDGEFYAACSTAADLASLLRQPDRVLPALRLASGMAPLHEQVQASLITTLAADGQQAEALAAFRATRARLAEDLGIDPGPLLQEAQRRVLDTEYLAEAAPNEISLSRPAQLPPGLPAFVGREPELATLAGLLAGTRTSPLIVGLDGMGGVGKSALATHFAHLVAGEFPDGQLHLDLRGNTGQGSLPVEEALQALLTSLGVPESRVPATVEGRIGAYRSLVAGRRVLLLLDDARDVAQVRPLLPSSARSLVLVTSRSPLIGLAALDGADLLHIELPDAATARALFRRRLERSPNRSAADLAADADVVDEIVDLCGRLPLALATLAGRLSARPRLPLASVAAELRHGLRKLAAFPSGHGLTDPRSVFAWSYHRLSPAAAGLFRLFALTPAPGVTAAACASLSGEDPAVVGPLLRELTEAGLLDEDDRGVFSAQVLVKACGEELLLTVEPDEEREAARTRLLEHYLDSSLHAAALLAPRSVRVVPAQPRAGVRPERPESSTRPREWFANNRDVLRATVRLAAEADAGVTPWQLALAMEPLRMSGCFDEWQDVVHVALRAARESGDRAGETQTLRLLRGPPRRRRLSQRPSSARNCSARPANKWASRSADNTRACSAAARTTSAGMPRACSSRARSSRIRPSA